MRKISNVGIIGGGTMGRYTARTISANYPDVNVTIYDNNLEQRKALGEDHFSVSGMISHAVKDKDLLVYCVPLKSIAKSFRDSAPYISENTIISDQLSQKSPLLDIIEECERQTPAIKSCSLLPIHTMCNPDPKTNVDPYNQRLALVNQRSFENDFEAYKTFLDSFSSRINIFDSIIDHDLRVANTQVNTSRLLLSIASSFAVTGLMPHYDKTYSDPLDVMKFAMAMRVTKPESHVYRGIQFGNELGEKIAIKSNKVENRLFGLIVSDKREIYRKTIMEAREKLFPSGTNPVLDSSDLEIFGDLTNRSPNSHFSLIQYAVQKADKGVSLYEDLVAGTPNFDVLVCMVDYLFRNEKLLETAINAPFYDPELRGQDLIFHDQINKWTTALVHQDESLFDHLHANMRKGLDTDMVTEEIKKSGKIVQICDKRLREAGLV